MNILIHIFVYASWLIPGQSHRWAKRLVAERKALKQATHRFNRVKKKYQ